MAKKTSTKKRTTKGTKTTLVPRGVRPSTAGFRVDGSIMKNGGCKKK